MGIAVLGTRRYNFEPPSVTIERRNAQRHLRTVGQTTVSHHEPIILRAVRSAKKDFTDFRINRISGLAFRVAVVISLTNCLLDRLMSTCASVPCCD